MVKRIYSDKGQVLLLDYDEDPLKNCDKQDIVIRPTPDGYLVLLAGEYELFELSSRSNENEAIDYAVGAFRFLRDNYTCEAALTKLR